jgi:RNA-directed DNA polymerase
VVKFRWATRLFACKEDAERVHAVLGKRLAKFGLELHPDKTRLIDFRSPAERVGAETTLLTSFTFLGFLHVWGKSRKGYATVWQRTAKDRLARTLKAINRQCRLMRPWPMADQHRRLCQMLTGHFAYFGISGNYKRLAELVHHTRRIWRKWLSRRSWMSSVPWARFLQVVARYPLPARRIIHPYT